LINLSTQKELDKLDVLEDQLKAKGLLNEDSSATINASRSAVKASQSIQLEANPASIVAMEGFTKAVGGVGAYVAAAQAVVDAGPNFLNSIADLLNSIERLPMAIADSFARVIDGVISLLTNFPTIFIQAISKIKDSIIKLIKEFPVAMQEFVLMIPDMLLSIVDAIPSIVTAFISTFLTALPKTLINAFKLVFIQLPNLIKGILKAVFIDLPIAIYDGFNQAFDEVKSILFGGDLIDTDAAKKELASYAASFAKSASSVFAVTDLAIASQQSNSISAQVSNAAKNAEGLLRKAWNWVIDNIWNPLASVVSNAFRWVVDNIFNPMYSVVSQAFMWVVDNILSPIGSIVMTAFRWVVDNVLTPLYNIVRVPFQWVLDNVISPIGNIVMTAFKWAYDNVISPIAATLMKPFVWFYDNVILWFVSKLPAAITGPFSDLIDIFSNFFKKIKDAFSDLFTTLDFGKFGTQIWEALASGLKGLSKIFDDVFAPILKLFGAKPDSNQKATSSTLDNLGSFFGFAEGGYVPGVATTPGNSKSNDKIAAMLSPGEAVISREMLAKPGVKELIDSILSNKPMQFKNDGGFVSPMPRLVPNFGSTTTQAQNVSMPITINNYSSTSMDTSFVRDKVIPEIRRELKSASLAGQYVISSKGVY
jgi:hypothetical protein